MAQENYVERCSMQRPPLLEPNGFCFWKARLETYVKSKDIDLGNSQVKNYKVNLLTQEYEKFLVSNEETIDSGFTRAKVTAIEEAKDLATLPLDELAGNLKVYEMILENDGLVSKTTTKDKVKYLALKAKVTREQTSDDSDSQDESDEDVDVEEAEAFNLLARNFRKTVNTWDLLEKDFIQRYGPPSKTAEQHEEIHNFKQEGDETLYQAWERYNDLLYTRPTHDLNNQQKVNIFYKGLDAVVVMTSTRSFTTP
ncbi:UBN2 domain-containing protein [Tanacetum coccineum]